jgi:ubiquinone/menaquinone biosynthesis C-methylase UbiE
MRILKKTLRCAFTYEGASLLDVGCGDGLFFKILSSINRAGSLYLVGLDIHFNPLWIKIKKHPALTVDFVVGDALHLPFRDEAFDIAFEKDTLHHVEDPLKTLKEMKRVVKCGGKTLIVEANRYNPIMYIHMTLIRGHQHFSHNRFRELVAELFKRDVCIVSTESHVLPFLKNSVFALRILYTLEDLLENVRLFKHLLSYNIAVGKKSECKDT